jgi:hypothetical protein
MTDEEGVIGKASGSEDPTVLVEMVLRQAYVEATEDLRAYAEKVRKINKSKKALRDYLAALRNFKSNVLSAARGRGVDLSRGNEKDVAALAALLEEYAAPRVVSEIEYELSLPDRIPPATVKTIDSLENEIARREEQLNSLGDDAQLANVDLQNVLQKQQQTLQMMSNISKMLHETAMAVIRKMGG